MKRLLGYSIRERGEGAARRFVVAFKHLAIPGKSWPERTPPAELRTRAAVARWAEGIIAAAEVGAPLAPPKRPSGPTVRALFEPWIAEVARRPGLEPATLAGYRSAFAAVILPTLGDEPAAGLDVARCRAWLRELRDRAAVHMIGAGKVRETDRKLSSSRINNCASTLSTFLSDAIADRRVSFATNPMLDPAVRRELPARPLARRVAVDRERPGCATMEDVQAVLDSHATPPEMRVRVALAFTGAERDGELAGLRVGAIRREPVPHLVIREAVKVLGPAGRATPGALKTASSTRIVPLHPAALAALDEWLSVHWIRLTGRAPSAEDFVFVRPGTTKPHRPKTAALFRRALAAAGRPTERGGAAVTFHRARHTFASALAAAGVPLELRALLLGHAAASVTEAAYTEHGLEQLATAVAHAVPLTWHPPTRQETRQSARQAAESGGAKLRDSSEVRTGFEPAWDGFANRPGLGEAGQARAAGGASSDTDRRSGNGPATGDGTAKRSAKPPRQVVEGLRRAAAAGLNVGLSDAAWATLGVRDDDVILDVEGL